MPGAHWHCLPNFGQHLHHGVQIARDVVHVVDFDTAPEHCGSDWLRRQGLDRLVTSACIEEVWILLSPARKFLLRGGRIGRGTDSALLPGRRRTGPPMELNRDGCISGTSHLLQGQRLWERSHCRDEGAPRSTAQPAGMLGS
jgi:hypothetical protein